MFNLFLRGSKAILLVLFFAATLAVTRLNFFQAPDLINDQAELTATQIKFTDALEDSKAVKIHTYTSPPMDSVNLHWIETNAGIILVDTGRFFSQARYALEEIRAASDKQIIGILITHPHTDHYGGLPVFAKAAIANVPIYASQITYNDIKTDGQGFIAARKKLHGNDFPSRAEIPLPNRIVKAGERFELGGLSFQAIDLPNNETIVTTLYYLPKQNVLFSGDIMTNKSIPFLGDGHSGNWLTQLRMLRTHYASATVYPGHGKPNRAQLLIEELSGYIKNLRGLVAEALVTDNKVTPQEKVGILTKMKARYSDYETSLVLPDLLARGIDGITQELKQGNT